MRAILERARNKHLRSDLVCKSIKLVGKSISNWLTLRNLHFAFNEYSS